MYQKIKAKFKANPTIFYACSIVASWAGVGSLMNFRTLAINNGAAAAIIWAVFNSLACIFFGLFAEYIPTVRRIMQSKVMFYFIGFLTVFQTWTQMSGIYEIFGDTPIGIAEQKHYKTMYEGLLYGDPKMRILRILWTTIYNDHNARIKEEQNHGKH